MKSRNSMLLMTGLLILFLVVGWTVYGQKKSAARQAWEYRGGQNLTEEQLNALGAEGWEMVSFSMDETRAVYFYFKRAKNP
jgi:hypothetical protein